MHFKKIIFALALFSLTLFGEINLEHNYNASVAYVKLPLSGEKYYTLEDNYLKVYNMDHSLWKSIAVPITYDGYDPQKVYLLSENFFSLSGNLEYLCVYYNSHAGSLGYKAVIVSETGNEMKTIPDCNYAYALETEAKSGKLICNLYDMSTYQTGNGVYSVPGHIFTSIKDNEISHKSSYALSSYPNPANGTIVIDYILPNSAKKGLLVIYNSLGQRVRSYDIGKSFHNLSLTTDQFSSGVYTYVVKVGNSMISTNKFVVTK